MIESQQSVVLFFFLFGGILNWISTAICWPCLHPLRHHHQTSCSLIPFSVLICDDRAVQHSDQSHRIISWLAVTTLALLAVEGRGYQQRHELINVFYRCDCGRRSGGFIFSLRERTSRQLVEWEMENVTIIRNSGI